MIGLDGTLLDLCSGPLLIVVVIQYGRAGGLVGSVAASFEATWTAFG